jgi:lipopolysaccharide/colanic/teichoic acid biosynthesis glycosyltransferase
MIKRGADLLFASVGLGVLSPLFALIALAIKFHDGGPIFFRQERVGREGRPFTIFKFRSMAQGAEKRGAAITVGMDSRITPLGHILRRYKLDELPQLLNVVRGEMSLVGPRPEVAKFVKLYSADQAAVLKLQPGITDPASFAFFDEAETLSRVADPERFYIEQLMVEKIRINLDYARKANFYTDLILILATLGRAVGLHFDIFSWLKIDLPNLKLKVGDAP